MARDGSAPVFLNCPRCGLTIRPRRLALTIEYCPRCLARTRRAVRLLSSSLPAGHVYDEGSAPRAEL